MNAYAALNLILSAMKYSFLISRRLNSYSFRRDGFVDFHAINAVSVLHIFYYAFCYCFVRAETMNII